MSSIRRFSVISSAVEGAGQPTVAQHGGPVGDVDDLVEAVAHQQDGLAAAGEAVERAHQPRHLGPGQRGRGLVEHQDAGVLTLLVLHGPHDGHHGPFGRAQGVHRRVRRHRDVVAVEQGLGVGGAGRDLGSTRPRWSRSRCRWRCCRPPTRPGTPPRSGARSAGPGPWPSRAWSGRWPWWCRPTSIVPAGVAVVHAGQDLDEGGLARSVAAQQARGSARGPRRRRRRSAPGCRGRSWTGGRCAGPAPVGARRARPHRMADLSRPGWSRQAGEPGECPRRS